MRASAASGERAVIGYLRFKPGSGQMSARRAQLG